MSVQGNPAATALIERFCDAHQQRDPDGPHVTTVDGVWGYCAGHGKSHHVWRPIEARPREQLETQIDDGGVI